MIHPHYDLAVKPLQSYFEKRFHRAHGKGFVSIAFLSFLSVLYIPTPKNCLQIFNGEGHCVRWRLHSLLNLSRRLSPEQKRIYVKAQPVLRQREKPIQQLVQDDEKKENIRRLSLHAEFWRSAWIWGCLNAVPGTGGREKEIVVVARVCDAPSTGGASSGVGAEEPCRTSPLLSLGVCRNDGQGQHMPEWLPNGYQNLKITDFSSSVMSTFRSVQMISLLSLQLILKVIENGRKAYAIFRLISAFSDLK